MWWYGWSRFEPEEDKDRAGEYEGHSTTLIETIEASRAVAIFHANAGALDKVPGNNTSVPRAANTLHVSLLAIRRNLHLSATFETGNGNDDCGYATTRIFYPTMIASLGSTSRVHQYRPQLQTAILGLTCSVHTFLSCFTFSLHRWRRGVWEN